MRLLCQTAHHQQTAFIVQQTSIFRELHREMAAIKAQIGSEISAAAIDNKVVKSTEIVNFDNASCVQQALLSEKTTNQPENDTSNYSATIRLERPTFGSSSTSGGVSRLESNSVSLTTPTVTRLDRLASNDESSSISDDTDRQGMSSRASGIIGASNDTLSIKSSTKHYALMARIVSPHDNANSFGINTETFECKSSEEHNTSSRMVQSGSYHSGSSGFDNLQDCYANKIVGNEILEKSKRQNRNRNGKKGYTRAPLNQNAKQRNATSMLL
jgi:hypothetical protein